MTTRNDVTGDSLVSKNTNNSYRDGWDRIFGRKSEDESQNQLAEVEKRSDEKSD